MAKQSVMSSRAKILLVLTLFFSGFVYSIWIIATTDWYMRGNASAPDLQGDWKQDSVEFKNLLFDGSITTSATSLRAECLRSVTITGEISLSDSDWQFLPVRKKFLRPVVPKNQSATSLKPLATIQVDVVRRSSLQPGYKSVLRGRGIVHKDGGARTFDFDVNFPWIPGDYLLLAHLVKRESLNDKNSLYLDEEEKHFLFARKINLVPFVRREVEKGQRVRLND